LGLFDLIPLARELVLENMTDGILIFDHEERVVDMNSSAGKILGIHQRHSIGQLVYEVIPNWREYLAERPSSTAAPLAFIYPLKGERFFDVRVNVIKVGREHDIEYGYVVVLRDVTTVKHMEDALRKTNEALVAKLGEVEQLQEKLKEEAIRDPLTNLYNRRFLEETLERELARAKRANSPLSIVMIDLDDFKRINDTYGHEMGDLILKELSSFLSAQIRIGDIACRYGGEEFLIVLPGTPLIVAQERVDEWRRLFIEKSFPARSEMIQISFSAGIGTYPGHGDVSNLIATADMAMYEAKRLGKNQVVAHVHLAL